MSIKPPPFPNPHAPQSLLLYHIWYHVWYHVCISYVNCWLWSDLSQEENRREGLVSWTRPEIGESQRILLATDHSWSTELKQAPVSLYLHSSISSCPRSVLPAIPLTCPLLLLIISFKLTSVKLVHLCRASRLTDRFILKWKSPNIFLQMNLLIVGFV